MDSIIQLLTDYGIGGVVTIIVAMVVTQFVKYPLKDWAERKFPNRKTIVTKWLFSIPVFLSFVGSLLTIYGQGGWGGYICSPDFDWGRVVAMTISCAGIALGAYSVGETFVKDKTTAQVEKLAAAGDEAAAASLEAANAKAKADKEAVAKAKENDKVSKQIQKLQEKLAKLNGQTIDVSQLKK